MSADKTTAKIGTFRAMSSEPSSHALPTWPDTPELRWWEKLLVLGILIFYFILLPIAVIKLAFFSTCS